MYKLTLQPVAGLLLISSPATLLASEGQPNAEQQVDCVRACLTGETTAQKPVTLLQSPSLPKPNHNPYNNYEPGKHRLTFGGSVTSFSADALDTATAGMTFTLFSRLHEYAYTEFEIRSESGTANLSDGSKVDVDHLRTSAEFGATANQWDIDWGAGLAYVQRDIAIDSNAIRDDGVSLHVWGLAQFGGFGLQVGGEINGAESSTGLRFKLVSPQVFGLKASLETRIYSEQVVGQASISYLY